MGSRHQPVSPEIQAATYLWRFGEVSFEVDAGCGARITAFRIGNDNILTGPEINPVNFGSTFWTSPQSQWGWPPIAEIDSAAYTVSGDGPNLVFQSPSGGKLGIGVTKRFDVDADHEKVAIEYVMENHSALAQTVAPWEISRLPTGGLTFFPSGGGVQPASKLGVRETEGAIWFDYDPEPITDHQKLFAHGSEGWVAHVDAGRRMLLLKTFPGIAPEDQAPGESEIELYADPGHTYVELEEQGPFRELGPGARVSWTVTWRLRRLPAAIVATVGNKDLLALARALAATGDRKARTRRVSGRHRHPTG
jgi:hypothetical protein